MKKRLLLIGLLASSLSMMAQSILDFGFETPTPALPVGKVEYVNFQTGDTHDSINVLSHTGTAALMLQNVNTVEGANWQRALKLRNLPVEPNTSYRLTFWVKGDNTYTLSGATTAKASNINAKLMVGKENADVPFVATGNKTFDYTFTGFDPANWTKKTAVFYYSTDAVQQAYYKTLKPDSVLTLNYFLNLAVYNPGSYFIDDISVKKSTIKGISFNGDVIKVDFGYAINGDAIRAGKDYETAVLPIESVNVTKDGVKLDVEAVEVQKNGFMIFLATDYLDDTAEGKLKISFTNPVASAVALKYTDALRPGSWDVASNMMVANFIDEEANYDMNLTGSSTIYSAPYLKSATPENESFDLPLSVRNFKFVYSKKIDFTAVKAVMGGPAGTINLKLSETANSDTLHFSVPAATNLIDGNYIITLSNILSDKGTASTVNDQLSLAYGQSLNAAVDTVFRDNWTGSNIIPTGWKMTYKTIVRESGTTQGSGPRLFQFPAGGDFTNGFYMRDELDTSRFTYGTYADKRLHLKAGKYSVSFYWAWWTTGAKSANMKMNFYVLDTLNKKVFSQRDIATTSLITATSTVPKGVTKCEYNFVISEESNYYIQWSTERYNFEGAVVGGIKVISIPSVAAKYKNMLTSALVAANAALSLADSSIYNGTAKNALKSTILAYATASYTTPSEYNAVVAIIDKATTSMKDYKILVDAHFASIVTYNTNVQTAKTTLATYAGTKYTVLSSFPKLTSLVAFYEPKALTNDDSLTVANDSLSFYTNLMKNWVNTAIPAMTYRLTKAVTLAKSLKVPVPASYLAAAEATMIDDDQIANALNIKIKQYLSHNLAKDSLKLGSSLIDSTAKDSVDMTCFIKNPNFYTTQTVNGLTSKTFPGWMAINFASSGVATLATPVSPVSDTYATVFNAKIDTFQQTVTGLPNGVYNVNMHVRTGNVGTSGVTQADINKFLRFYVIHGTDTTYVGFTQSSTFGITTEYVSVRNMTLTDGDSFTLGIKTTVSPFSGYTPSLFWGDPSLWLVGKSGTYTGVKETLAVKGAIKDVQYYTIQGFRMNAPGRGLNIVRTIYENGAVEVQKIMIK